MNSAPTIGKVPDPSMHSTIDRSAANSAKGPRLQRLRVALFLLDAIAERENVQAYAAVEAEGDVFVATSTSTLSTAYSEEDKNYDEDGAFTFVSAAVINSIVLFADQWLNWRGSATLKFGLCTTVAIGKEKNAGRVKELGLKLPSKAILELLRARDYSDPDLLPCVIALVLDEYEAQYKKTPSAIGYLSILKSWSQEKWIEFLGLISWLFSDADESKAEEKLVEGVKKCRFYNDLHEGKEEIVSSALLDLFDKKQLAPHFGDRFVHASEVDVLFRKVASGEIRATDPTWRAWVHVPTPTDQRNVSEKLTAACPTLSSPALKRYQRRTAAGLLELDAHAQDKNILALRYQIFDVCEGALSALVARTTMLTEAQLETELNNLTSLAVERVAERAKEYGYSHRTETFVRGLVLELFDSCFLAFDEGGS
ncbi:hypothetical protein ACIHQR_29980 [Corallococcus coralloides]|uniref:hypothetical protein n=1 Tax=Corallococcus coralloides TaxID=184914 RepID=UPI00385156ED